VRVCRRRLIRTNPVFWGGFGYLEIKGTLGRTKLRHVGHDDFKEKELLSVDGCWIKEKDNNDNDNDNDNGRPDRG
jgi:hypothetical protein